MNTTSIQGIAGAAARPPGAAGAAQGQVAPCQRRACAAAAGPKQAFNALIASLAGLLLVATDAAQAGPVLGAERVLNGGFELGLGELAPAGWTYVPSGFVEAAGVEAGPAHGGSQAYAFRGASAGHLQQWVPTAVGVRYTVSAWWDVHGFTNMADPSNGFWITVDGAWLCGKSVMPDTLGFVSNAALCPFDEQSFIATGDHALIDIQANYFGGEVLLDDVSVREVLAEPPPGRLPEPSSLVLAALGLIAARRARRQSD